MLTICVLKRLPWTNQTLVFNHWQMDLLWNALNPSLYNIIVTCLFILLYKLNKKKLQNVWTLCMHSTQLHIHFNASI